MRLFSPGFILLDGDVGALPFCDVLILLISACTFPIPSLPPLPLAECGMMARVSNRYCAFIFTMPLPRVPLCSTTTGSLLTVPLTTEHSPINGAELKRIRARGGFVQGGRVNVGISLA